MNDHLLEIIQNIPEGYSEGIYRDSKYSVTKETFNKGKSFKILAEELKGTNFISLNFYCLKQENLLKPCEMPFEKVIHFLENLKYEEQCF